MAVYTDDTLWDTKDLVALRHLGELGHLDHICRDVRISDRKLVGQPGRTWTVRSGRGDEDLDVEIALEAVQRLPGRVK